MMITLESYTRLLTKVEIPVIPNEDGVLDLNYVNELSSQFMHAIEKDVNVAECWQRDTTLETLEAFI